MNGPVPSVDDLVAAALEGDPGLDPRSSQEPEKVASGEPTDLCSYMEKVAGELEDWALGSVEDAVAHEKKVEGDWQSFQQDRMFKVALARTMIETIAHCSGNKAISEADWDEVLKVAAENGVVLPPELTADLVDEVTPAKPKSRLGSIAAIGIPASAVGGGAKAS